MRTVAIIVLAATVGLVLQSTAVQVLRLDAAVPDVLLVLCVYLGLRYHTVGGAIGAFALGYAEDSVSGGAVGLNAFAMSAAFLLVYLTSRRLWVDNMLSKVVVVLLASLVKIAAVTILFAVFLAPEQIWGATVGSLALQSVLTAALGPPLLAILASTERLAEEEAE
ncbi:MAG: rod shape-determining protein MreD [Acidobacteria bacterium RBG_16_68_9]|nr:MAG: rod shape-determining protein MreD [Acidobacteria bacterium RBG_16_68_9]